MILDNKFSTCYYIFVETSPIFYQNHQEVINMKKRKLLLLFFVISVISVFSVITCSAACNHSYETTTTPATMTTDGHTITACSKCGYETENRVIYRIKTVKLKKSKVVYNAKSFLPEIIVKDSQGNTLNLYYDYTDNRKYVKEIGKYKIDVWFSYPYSGSATVTFEITSPVSTPKLLSAKSTTKGAKITWEGQKKAHGYVVYRKAGNEAWKRLGRAKDTSYIDSTAVYNKTYKYTVKAFYEPENESIVTSGYDKKGISLKITKVRTPAKPTVTSKSLCASIKLNKVEGATKYEIYRATSKNGKYKLIYTAKKDKLSYTDKNVKINKTYFYKVKAYTGSKASALSSYSKVLIRLDAPKINKSVTATKTTVTFTWNAVKGADYYRVYARKSTKDSWKKIKTLNATDKPSYTAKFNGNTDFTVVAVKKLSNATVTSPKADYMSARPMSQPKISIHHVEPTSPTITTESKFDDNATDFILYCKAGENGKWNIIDQRPLSAFFSDNAAYVYQNVKIGTTYYFKVRGYANRGAHRVYGPFSETISLLLKYNPDVQIILPKESTDGYEFLPVTIKNNGTTTLRIYRDAYMKNNDYLYSGDIHGFNFDYIDIPAKSSATLNFMSDINVDGNYPPYSTDSCIVFKFKCNGTEYYSAYSYSYGNSFNLNR